MMLLGWRVPHSANETARWIRAYLRRWSIEDAGRASKQLVGIEDCWLQSLRTIVRLVRLAGIALGWLCLLLLFARRTAAEILGRAKTVGRKPLSRGKAGSVAAESYALDAGRSEAASRSTSHSRSPSRGATSLDGGAPGSAGPATAAFNAWALSAP